MDVSLIDDDSPTVTSAGSSVTTHDTRPMSAPIPTIVGYRRGDSIDRYLILDVLGEGNMGAVFLAHDPELDRQVALKILRPDGRHRDAAARDAAQRRLAREARALGRLNHPNVVQIHDAGTNQRADSAAEADVFIAMELVEGASLKDWQAAGERSWEDILRVYLGAARGIAAAHAAGLIHRDIKPANILIGEDGRARVADFGLVGATSTVDGSFIESVPLASASDTWPIESDDDARDAICDNISDAVCDASDKHSLARATSDTVFERMTVAGTILGTPRYMSPEQLMGLDIGPSADQFGLCTALYEAIYGVLPYGRIVRERWAALGYQGDGAMPAGKLSEPVNLDAPRWLRPILARGLHPDVDERYPSMDELVAAIEKGWAAQARPRRYGIAMIAFVILGVLFPTALGFAPGGLWYRDPCDQAANGLAGIWDEEAQAAIETRFVESGVVSAIDRADRLAAVLHPYAETWSSMNVALCRAPADPLAVAKRVCLERRKERLAALVDVLRGSEIGNGTVDPSALTWNVLFQSVPAAQALPALDDCADPGYLSAAVPPPDDPEERLFLSALWPRLARLEADNSAGRYREGVAEADELIDLLDLDPAVSASGAGHEASSPLWQSNVDSAAHASGEAADTVDEASATSPLTIDEDLAKVIARDAASKRYQPFVAQLLAVSAHLYGAVGAFDEADALTRRAIMAAARSGNDALMAEMWGALLELTGSTRERLEEAKPLMQWAQLFATHTDDERAQLAVTRSVAQVWITAGRLYKARDSLERALTLLKQSQNADVLTEAQLLSLYGWVLTELGERDPGETSVHLALVLQKSVLGEDHPDIADTLAKLGGFARKRGDQERAQQHYEQALAIRQAALGPEHPLVANILYKLGALAYDVGELAQSRRFFLRALAVREASLGPDHPSIAVILNALGVLAEGTPEAEGIHRRALAIRLAAFGERHPDVVVSLIGLGSAVLLLGKAREAEDIYRRAIAIREALTGRRNAHLGFPLIGLGEALIKQGRLKAAEAPLRRAIDIYEQDLGPEHYELAVALNPLSELYRRRGDYDTAVALAERSLDVANKFLEPYASEALAKALWGRDRVGDRAWAEGLLMRAWTLYNQRGEDFPKQRLESWFADRGLVPQLLNPSQE